MKWYRQLLLLLPRKHRSLPDHLRGGRIGEDAAARYLFLHGYRIHERNFVSGKNEIDIIAEKNNTYVFCEVKTRMQDFGEDAPFGRPAAAVNAAKQRNLIAAATTFEGRHRREGKFYRFDVIEVYVTPAYRVSHICHMESAFTR
ncbi:MAG: YraN family protein [Ruminococcaceae bacterium]|nr:YraN family protein [Oscillospiraceae bacterium]